MQAKDTKILQFISVILCLLLVACEINPTQTRTIPSQLPTQRPTSIVTNLSTRTAHPTSFPIPGADPTNTITPIKTPNSAYLPSATPFPEAQYRLREWTVDDAQASIDAIRNSLPNQGDLTQTGSDVVYDLGTYINSMFFVTSEAAVRFPDSPQAINWRWQAAHYAIQAGNANWADPLVPDLISDTLNSRQTDLSQLSSWFKTYAHDYSNVSSLGTLKLELSVESLNLPGFSSSSLLYLNGEELGGMCLLVIENDDQYETSLLFSSLLRSDGFRNYVECFPADITNNGILDVVVSHYTGGHVGTTYLQVYSLDQTHPRLLPFFPSGEVTFSTYSGGYNGIRVIDGVNSLEVSEWAWNNPCTLDVDSYYQWNGEWIELTDFHVNQLKIPGENPEACAAPLRTYIERWPTSKSIEFEERVLSSWPKEGSTYLAPNERDRERIQLGVLYALNGDNASSRSTITDVIDNPSIITSIWIPPAQAYLDSFTNDDDLYRAFTKLLENLPTDWDRLFPICNHHEALEYLVSSNPPGSYMTIVDKIRSYGAEILDSGYYDFEDDRLWETGFTLRHPGQTEIEFWLISDYPSGIKALFVGQVSSSNPIVDIYESTVTDIPFLLEGSYLFTFKRLSSGEPFVIPIPSQHLSTNGINLEYQNLLHAEYDLFAGAEPEFVRETLESYQETSGVIQYPLLTYLLALSYELEGNEPLAVDTNLSYLSQYPDDFLTILARMKLVATDP